MTGMGRVYAKRGKRLGRPLGKMPKQRMPTDKVLVSVATPQWQKERWIQQSSQGHQSLSEFVRNACIYYSGYLDGCRDLDELLKKSEELARKSKAEREANYIEMAKKKIRFAKMEAQARLRGQMSQRQNYTTKKVKP